MAKGKGARIKIQLECTTCRKEGTSGVSRYSSIKNKKNTPDRIERNKYCRFEQKHTLHKEVK
ncbi:MAG: 50S ribosomal protein L33 [Bacteriovoracaceae bacterium]|nr:50S ribosomal protein L33 [Bacteriovoracaceae bacterium]